MLWIAICEDEGEMAVVLAQKVQAYFADRELGWRVERHTSAEQLLFAGRDYDIVLLDIRLPGMSGMEAARRLRQAGKGCAIVFITSSREDVFDAFDVDAVQFLVKPVEDSALHRALHRAVGRIEREREGSLLLHGGNVMRRIAFGEILYCEAVNHQVVFYLKQGDKIAHYCRIKEIEAQMDGRFCRCHRSYLVNLAHIVALEDGAARVDNGDQVLVSRRLRGELARRLLLYLREEVQ